MSTNSSQGESTTKRHSVQSIINRYQKSSSRRSVWQIIDSIVPYLGILVLMYFSMRFSYWITLALTPFAAGFLIRVFIIFHDCGHGSFFKSKKANHFWGVVSGILTMTPYYSWRQRHAMHHATSGDLDRRGVGDVWTMTVKEYMEASRSMRFKYRFYRNPIVLHFLGPLQILLIQNRRVPKDATKKERNSILGTDLALLLVVLAAIFTIGLKAYLLIQIPVYMIGTAFGIWLFYVQHQFEGVYWERHENWDFIAASLDGSSYYELPKVVQWFSGNIGFHHIHHLNARIPNYYLEKCHDEIVHLRPIKSVRFWRSLKSLQFRLWDEDANKLVGFSRLRSLQQQEPA